MRQRSWHKRGSRAPTRTASTTGWTLPTDPSRLGTLARLASFASRFRVGSTNPARSAVTGASSNCLSTSRASRFPRPTRIGSATSCTAAPSPSRSKTGAGEPPDRCKAARQSRTLQRPAQALSGPGRAV